MDQNLNILIALLVAGSQQRMKLDPTLNLLIALLIFDGSEERMARIVRRTIPAALPGSPGERLTVAAIEADKELSSQEDADFQIVQDVVTNATVKKEELPTRFKEINKLFTNLPEAVQANIHFTTG